MAIKYKPNKLLGRTRIKVRNRVVKKYSKKYTNKIKKIAKVIKARPVVASIQSAMPLNLDFYNVADGVYTSYWAGKLISVLQRSGKKKIVAKHFYRAAVFVKLTLGLNPLLVLLETLDKIKPNFRLRNYIVRRTIIKEYPVVVLRPRQLILAVHWLKEEIRSNTPGFGATLGSEIAAKLIEFKQNPKKNNLIKKRSEYTARVIRAQFNVRYNFK